MKILAFETSCDDTAVAIVENGTDVLASVRHSQVEHEPYGGVVPEIAARLHSERWRPVLEECLSQANCSISDIDYLAVTNGPGLQTSLLTGTTAASFLSLLHQKPLIPVHHVLGHVCSTALERDPSKFQFPSVVLTVSGGHTDFYLRKNFIDVQKIGQTRDDAAGEAYDKVAKMLGLGYPGGPIVSQKADQGNPKAFDLPRIFLEKDSLDFSFSGLKAAVYRLTQESDSVQEESFIADVCASFQEAVVDIFLKKIVRVFQQYPDIHELHFVGGVSANKRLREEIKNLCHVHKKQFFTTQKFEYSTDNAAMIAGAAYFLVQKNPDVAQVQFVDGEAGLAINDQ
ncbi:tRNA (adenosine(37)-N6)-threonylcarbamoyltransferase complex transferase subunit TsaD [Candidatus Gracilibacteria bacterium]|nr:tRNA (adenosine(37)-N6)-threonylcarbamoyltransferase complex transferase subunit TsaD [Candidatus Gracilibacteria bacterium]MCF7819029.1 tRNA (adenosine(37)-N6)-threonylcarbamoyltransferase complex transferase subunit TsaD [Candidatus Gracilibacteria bacterium]